MTYSFDDKRLLYTGRIDHRKDGAYFYFPSSSVKVVFKGSSIGIIINNKNAWGNTSIGYIIDGRMGRLPLRLNEDGTDAGYTIAERLDPDKVHECLIYKRMAANHSFALKSIYMEGELLQAEDTSRLSLEFYGDSVSAGEVTEADAFVGQPDPCCHEGIYDNSWYSYTWQVSRLLNARFHNISQGGIAVFDDTGWFHGPKMIGMESVYDKMCYFPEGGELTEWDFSRYTPDICVFALGQNDQHNGITNADDISIYDPDTRTRWKEGYKKLVKDVISHYPHDTKVIMITTVLMHDREWDNAIDEIVNELRTDGINAYHFLFSRNGAATPGHPRRAEHSEMASELARFIESIEK
jgi:hypothetical protein